MTPKSAASTMVKEHDIILKGNPAANVRGLCDQTRENTKNIMLHDQDHKDNVVPVLADYTANKNRFEGAYKFIILVTILLGLAQAYLTWQQTVNTNIIKTYISQEKTK